MHLTKAAKWGSYVALLTPSGITNLSPSTQDTPTNQGEYIVAWITTSTFYKIEIVTTCQVNGQELHSTKVTVIKHTVATMSSSTNKRAIMAPKIAGQFVSTDLILTRKVEGQCKDATN